MLSQAIENLEKAEKMLRTAGDLAHDLWLNPQFFDVEEVAWNIKGEIETSLGLVIATAADLKGGDND